jgi:hypothetical protein
MRHSTRHSRCRRRHYRHYPIDSIDLMQPRESLSQAKLARLAGGGAVVIALLLTVAAAYAGACRASDILAEFHRNTLPLKFSKPPGLHAVARQLEVAARDTVADARPFEFQIRFNPWYLSAMKEPPPFGMDGLFASACEQTRFLTVDWGSGDRTQLNLTSSRFHQGKAFSRRIRHHASRPKPPPGAELTDEHPALGRWTVDLPEIGKAIKEHSALFGYGLYSIDITTVKRFRYLKALSAAGLGDVMFLIHKPDGAGKSLPEIDDSRTIVELLETGRDRADPPCVDGVKGHYLIIDATSAKPLEHGIYMKCLTEAIQSCSKDADCPGVNRCERNSCGRTNLGCKADGDCKYTESCDHSQPDGALFPGKCAPRGGHYPEQ